MLAGHRAAGLAVPVKDLEPLAARLGSDVPFMLYGGTMLATGRGERLLPLEPLTGGHFVVVKPPVDLSTAEVYQKVNLALTRHRYRINLKQVNALLSRFPNVTLTFRNALEDVVCPSYPIVSALLGELLAERPRFAAMSGSGSALFAVFGSESKAIRVAERFSVRGFYSVVTAPSRRAVDIEPTEPHSVGSSKGGA